MPETSPNSGRMRNAARRQAGAARGAPAMRSRHGGFRQKCGCPTGGRRTPFIIAFATKPARRSAVGGGAERSTCAAAHAPRQAPGAACPRKRRGCARSASPRRRCPHPPRRRQSESGPGGSLSGRPRGGGHRRPPASPFPTDLAAPPRCRRVSRPGLAGCLGAIAPGSASARDIARAAGVGTAAAESILERLAAAGIGSRCEGGAHRFADGDRLRAAVLAVSEDGAPVDEVSEHIGWRDFEGLVAEMLERRGFDTARNLRVGRGGGRRGVEIDVAATRGGTALLVDCKHWRRSNASALAGAARRQADRARIYAAGGAGARAALPVIVTLHEDGIRLAGRVPVVPVLKLGSFADEFHGSAGDMAVFHGGGS